MDTVIKRKSGFKLTFVDLLSNGREGYLDIINFHTKLAVNRVGHEVALYLYEKVFGNSKLTKELFLEKVKRKGYKHSSMWLLKPYIPIKGVDYSCEEKVIQEFFFEFTPEFYQWLYFEELEKAFLDPLKYEIEKHPNSIYLEEKHYKKAKEWKNTNLNQLIRLI